jgi:hypothetical protein
MKKYDVKTDDGYVEILAEHVKWSDSGLEFIRGNEIIALFLKWDYWIYRGTIVGKL